MQIQLQNLKLSPSEDVIVFLIRAKLLFDEFAVVGTIVPIWTFNATVYNNLGKNYKEAVTTLVV